MKNIIYTLIVGLLVLIAGCDDFLEVKPQSRVVPDDFLDSELEVEQGVTAVYRRFRDLYVQEQWKWGELQSDNTSNDTLSNRERPQLVDEFLLGAGDELIETYWQTSYNGIHRTNILINALIDPDPALRFESPDLGSRYEGEARFFRAFFYFNLVRLFGDVPVITFTFQGVDDIPVFANTPREPTENVYRDIIIPDLEIAVANLPESYSTLDAGRVTKGAALALLGEANLTRGEYAAAIESLEQINEIGYTLNSNYKDNFDPATKNGPESIFELQFSLGASQPANFFRNWIPANSGNGVFSSVDAQGEAGKNQPTLDMVNAYEPGDDRADVSINFFYRKFENENGVEDSVAIQFIGKYNFEFINQSGIRGQDINLPVYRYADVLLMLAEAYNENNLGSLPDAAILYLNRVRSRAGLNPLLRGRDFNSGEELRLLILQERRVELAFENKRWFDLLRMESRIPNYAQDLMEAHGQAQIDLKGDAISGQAYDNIRLILGLPAEEVGLYGYEQNEGWE